MGSEDNLESFTKDCASNISEGPWAHSENMSSDSAEAVENNDEDKLSLQERFGNKEVFNQPSCLVFTDKEMNFKINEEILDEINSIDVTISVVGICGVYRTGKSYLMNLLAEEKKGFSVGNRADSSTKGIWAWCKPHPTICDRVVIFLDTEGLSSPEKRNAEHDAKLFCLTMLMSSILIYNNKGVIDRDTLDRLSFITNITKNVSVGRAYCTEEEDKNALQIISPAFVLCLRDFFFDIGDSTPDQYMENCLQESQDKQDAEFNATRRSIKTFFPTRKCFRVAQPAMNDKLLSIETQPKDIIEPKFWEDVESMVEFLHGIGPKLMDNALRQCWNGNTFKTFLRAYIKQISNGHKMDYASAMTQAAMYRNRQLKVTICRVYQSKLEKWSKSGQLDKNICKSALKYMHTLLKRFRQDAYTVMADEVEENALETMKEIMDKYVSENRRRVKQKCDNYLRSKHETMLKENKYDGKDGISNYKKDFDGLLQKYNTAFDNYDNEERCNALREFADTIEIQVTKLEYKAKLQEELDRYEAEKESQRRSQEEMECRLEKEKNDLKEDMRKKMQDILDEYVKMQSSKGFFKRLKYLFTGKMDPPIDEENTQTQNKT